MKKFQRCLFCWPCTQSAKRSKHDTKKIFTGHGLRITKRPAVWYFSIFLFEKYQFLWEIFYLHLESSRASRKWKNLNVVLFADSVLRIQRDPSMTLKKNFSLDSSGQNSKCSKETVKWQMANVFTVKKLTISPGWLLRKRILEGLQWSVNSCYRKLGHGARCIKVGNGPLSARLSDVHWVMHAVKVFQINTSSLFVCFLSKIKGVACIHWLP